jgi:aldehyde dehydrogenase (NAD+)
VSDKTEVLNPATEEVIGVVPVGTAADAEAAVASARHAFDEWAGLDPVARCARLRPFLDALRSRGRELATLVVAETGAIGPLAKRLHVDTALDHFEWFLDAGSRPAVEERDGPTKLVVREPVGVVGAITPFNFPFFLNIEKIAPALVAGNTVVLKPSPLTPLEALVIADVADEVGLPRGVLSVVTGGLDVGRVLTTDPRVDLVTFTGSDAVGAQVMAQAAPTLKRVLLELGGKSALIVRPDADLDGATLFGLSQLIVQAGQGCALCTRHLIHASIVDEYVERLVALAEAVVVGDPAQRGVGMGPLIRPAQVERVNGLVQTAVTGGAGVACGGRRPPHVDRGFFYEPTVLTGVTNDATVARREVFGPVAVVIPFTDDDDAVRMANDSDYGLGGAVWSDDTEAALAIALRVRTGYLTVNGGGGAMHPALPFGGYKRSGVGRELGVEGLDAYTELKSIDLRVA